MPAVEFHILSDAGDVARMRHACQLVEQSYARGERSYVCASDAGESQRMDEMLWTFRDQAFIPHEIASTSSPSHPRIMALIGTETMPASFASTLINISNSVPDGLESVTQLIEVVDADPQHKQQARERYKQYRDRGYTLETKNL
ncbi:MAG: DNA polymerase III subunit chi [Steroidobacter sp.]